MDDTHDMSPLAAIFYRPFETPVLLSLPPRWLLYGTALPQLIGPFSGFCMLFTVVIRLSRRWFLVERPQVPSRTNDLSYRCSLEDLRQGFVRFHLAWPRLVSPRPTTRG